MTAFLIELHLPVWLNRLEVFAVGTFSDYVDKAGRNKAEMAWLEEVFQPLGEGIRTLLASGQSARQIDIAISDQVLGLLDSPTGKPYLENWRTLLDQINWRGSMPAPQYNYAFLEKAKEMAGRVQPVLETWERLLGKRPDGFYLPFGLYANPLAYAAGQLGFNKVWVFDPQAQAGSYAAQHLPEISLGVYGNGHGATQWIGHQTLNREGGVAACLEALMHFVYSHAHPDSTMHTYEWPYFERHPVYPKHHSLQQNYYAEITRLSQSRTVQSDSEMVNRLILLSQAHILQELNPAAHAWLGEYR
ncbi:MAG: hypothetical protein AAFV07_11030, partial [Bacteroidota bacterium]